jgi:hypothetical protein
MSVNYTNRKGQTYTLYKGQTKAGKPRYYFGRTASGQAEPVTEIPPGFSISKSVNGVVSLAKDRPSLIQPEEIAAIEAEIKQHPQAHLYRISVKQDLIEIYEQTTPDLDTLLREMDMPFPLHRDRLQANLTSRAQYAPVLRFTLLDPTKRQFGAKRMCYRSSIDGWLELMQTGSIADLADALIPTLGTDDFFELM